VRFVAIVLASGVLLGVSGTAHAAHAAKSCPDLDNAVDIVATGALSCRLVGAGIEIYQGAPIGCVEGSRCGQSGVSPGGATMFASCRRQDLHVGCTIGVIRRHKQLRSKVRFTMLHDPYNCPGAPVCP
jgi:hypothetical protein